MESKAASEGEGCASAGGSCLIVLLSVAIGIVLRGWVLCVLWGWFVVPTFGAPELSIPVALGLGMLGSYLLNPPNLNEYDQSQKRSTDELVMRLALVQVFFPLIILLCGWLVHLFM